MTRKDIQGCEQALQKGSGILGQWCHCGSGRAITP